MKNKRTVSKILSEMLNVSISKIESSSNFVKDLSADSLDEVEILMAIEDEYELIFSDEEMSKAKTVQDVIDFLRLKNVDENYLSI